MASLARSTLLASLLALSACGGGDGDDYTPFPPYFAFDGQQTFVASRNLAGRSVDELKALLDKAADEGTTLVRFHVTHAFGPGITSAGEVDEAWAASWDEVFEYAEASGIHVLPVFGVWADWNDGSDGEVWHLWHENPLNPGDGSSPAKLYRSGSGLQRAWLAWLRALATRWQAHPNVAAWEIFSELDLVTHAGGEAEFEAGALRFVDAAAAVLRDADPLRRPVTASLAGWNRWLSLYASDAIDLAQVHLYGPEQNLDMRIWEAARMLRPLGKPLLLGESGLDWRPPDGTTATTSVHGPLATRHAVWAALTNGFMNGRALWWEDGYAVLQNGDPSVSFVAGYPAVERGALAVLGGRDMSRMRALADEGMWMCNVIGDERTALGWLPDWQCGYPQGSQPPDCAVMSGLTCEVAVPGGAARWEAVFHDTTTGAALGPPLALTRTGRRVVVPLPDFTEDVAFVLTATPDPTLSAKGR
jgi:hypothetical protein